MQEKGKSLIDQYIISKVREKRLQHEFSQSELATLLNVSNGFIGQAESTRYPTKYSTDQLNELSKIFKCSPREFLPENSL